MMVLKVMFLNGAPLYAVNKEYTGVGLPSSKGEHMWLSYMEWKLGSRGYLRHLYNHPHGQEHIRYGPKLKQSFYPDGIYRDLSARTIHIYEVCPDENATSLFTGVEDTISPSHCTHWVLSHCLRRRSIHRAISSCFLGN